MAADAHRDFKDRLYGQFARIGKALSNPHRLELLELLAQGERTVESLVDILRSKGRRARRLLEGFPEWRAAGFPVHTGLEQYRRSERSQERERVGVEVGPHEHKQCPRPV